MKVIITDEIVPDELTRVSPPDEAAAEQPNASNSVTLTPGAAPTSSRESITITEPPLFIQADPFIAAEPPTGAK